MNSFDLRDNDIDDLIYHFKQFETTATIKINNLMNNQHELRLIIETIKEQNEMIIQALANLPPSCGPNYLETKTHFESLNS